MDDLLDLSWSDSKKQDGGSRPGSSFDLLSKPQSGANYFSNSGKSTPLQPASHNTSSPNPNLASAAKNGSSTATPARTQSPATSDAFSSLLGMSNPGKQNLTMAEKQAQLAAQKAAEAESDKARWGNGDFWNKLEGGNGQSSADILAPKPQAVKSKLGPALQPASSDSSRPASAAAPSPAPAVKAGTFWDNHGDLLAPVKSQSRSSTPASRPSSAQPNKSQPTDDFTWDDDDDLLGGAVAPKAKSSTQPQNWEGDLLGGSSRASSKPKTPADPWDLDALASAVPAAPTDTYGGDSDDDLLGELGRPARSPRRSPPPQTRPAPTRNGAASPPPHIIGQIVEMGFPPDQARRALASTESGEDVQAALEMLLASRGNTPAPQRPQQRRQPERQQEDSEDEYERLQRERKARHAARRAGPARDTVRPRTSEERERERERDNDRDEAFDTDRIVAQASELGANMLSKATSFWNTSKEKALKVYEEQKRALDAQQAASRRKPPTDGRPRWMLEAEAEERGETLPPAAEFGEDSLGFHDDHSGDEEARPVQTRKPQPKPQAQPQPQSQPPSVKDRTAALFADEPRRYVSKHRHAAGRSPAPQSRPTTRPASPLKQRTLVDATPKQISTASEHKSAGNEHFKLGRFAEAEVSYSIAIASLPAGHISLIPLFNNRAATRLKLGHAMPAVEDCTAAIDIIGIGYHPAKEVPIDSEVKLGDALVKATGKRAQAYEMAEKWSEAMKDWERLLGYDSALGGSRSGAGDGVRRAKAMVSGGEKPDKPKSMPKSKPKSRPAPPADVHSSSAVGELRKAAQAAEREDEERLAIKDSVDDRIESWKKGKEGNVRALLASLDAVLWEGVVTKVGMHELVTEKQVKIKYMKTIARLHPDKLAAAGVTVEQRMLANGVFGTLSEAWQAFQGA